MNINYTDGILSFEDYNYIIKKRPHSSMSNLFNIIKNSVSDSINNIYQILLSIQEYSELLNNIPFEQIDDITPFWNNRYLPHLDGIMIFTLLGILKSNLYVEVGSGNSTKFAFKAIHDLGIDTKIYSIDPNPRAEIDKICTKTLRNRLEDIDVDFFKQLKANDILIIDNSHRVYPNSDVVVFFTEILPILASGVYYGIHDIALPDEVFTERLYTEQYMLSTYLLAGAAGDKIIFHTSFLSTYTNIMKDFSTKSLLKPGIRPIHHGGFFWMQKA